MSTAEPGLDGLARLVVEGLASPGTEAIGEAEQECRVFHHAARSFWCRVLGAEDTNPEKAERGPTTWARCSSPREDEGSVLLGRGLPPGSDALTSGRRR